MFTTISYTILISIRSAKILISTHNTKRKRSFFIWYCHAGVSLACRYIATLRVCPAEVVSMYMPWRSENCSAAVQSVRCSTSIPLGV